MFECMWRDDYLYYCSVQYIDIRKNMSLYFTWSIAYVTLTPNSRLVWGYRHISGRSK